MRRLKERFLKQYAYLLIIFYSFYLVFFINNLKSFEWRFEIYCLIFSILMSLLTVIFEKKILDYVTFRFMVNSQIIYISCELCVFSFIFYPNFPTLFVYLIVIPINFLLVNNIKRTLLVSIILTFFSLSILYLGSWNVDAGLKQSIKANDKLIFLFVNYFPSYTSLISIVFVSYYHLKFTDFKKSEADVLLKAQQKMVVKEDKRGVVLEAVFQRCEELMKEKKVYLNPEYSIIQLAKDVNSNQNYVSNALSKIGNTNFRDFINNYRLEKVMSEIKSDKHKSFKLNYIYTRSGFRHASNFNRAFKKKYGGSPSEMIKKMK